jgi:hypothetical protein
MKQQRILRICSAALAAAIVVAGLAGLDLRLAAQSVAERTVRSSESGEPVPCSSAPHATESLPTARAAESRLARLWADVALKPESAVALARLANAYAEAGETELALQSFQVALDQLSMDPDLQGPARAQFRQTVEKRIRLLRNPGLSFASTRQAEGQGKKQNAEN